MYFSKQVFHEFLDNFSLDIICTWTKCTLKDGGRGGSVVGLRTLEQEVQGSNPTIAV